MEENNDSLAPHLGKNKFLVMKLVVACMENDASQK